MQKEPKKIMGTAFFFLGIVLVFLRWALVGMALELFGAAYLFGSV